MKLLQYLLHGVFIVVNSYAIIIAWKMNGFRDLLKQRSWNEQVSELLDNAGPAVAISLTILAVLHLLINKRINGDFRAGNILLFLLADILVVSLLVWLGVNL